MSTRQMGRSIHKSTCLRRWSYDQDESGPLTTPQHQKRKRKPCSDKKPAGLEAEERSLTSRASNLFYLGLLASTAITAILSLCWMFLSESRGLQILDVFQLVLSTSWVLVSFYACQWLPHCSALRILLIEGPWRLVSFETSDQSDEETWHDQHVDNFEILIFFIFWNFLNVWKFFTILAVFYSTLILVMKQI